MKKMKKKVNIITFKTRTAVQIHIVLTIAKTKLMIAHVTAVDRHITVIFENSGLTYYFFLSKIHIPTVKI